MSNRALYEKFAGDYRKIEADYCLYCHGPFEAYDHFIPVAVAALVTTFAQRYKVLIPCCKSCNSTAGARVFKSFEEKQTYIIERRTEWEPSESARTVKKSSVRIGIGKSSARLIAGRPTTLLAIVTQGVHGKRLTRIYKGYHLMKELNSEQRKILLDEFQQEYLINEGVENLARFMQNKCAQLYLGIHPLPV